MSRTEVFQKGIVLGQIGIGDDLMFFWAWSALSLAGRVPRRPIYFENPKSRIFLSELARFIPQIEVSATSITTRPVTYVRMSNNPYLRMSGRALLGNLIMRRDEYASSYHHKLLTEFGNKWRPDKKTRLLLALNMVYAWKTPYEAFYDGLQEVCVTMRWNNGKLAILQDELCRQWYVLRSLIARNSPVPSMDAIVFPGGNSYQDFDTATLEAVKSTFPGIRVARHKEDVRPADLRYADLQEARTQIQYAKITVTNDSTASHLAQFFARKHFLIASRSRPGNICYPGALNTCVIDLGSELTCRPCAYRTLDKESCSAGFSRCAAFMDKVLLKSRLVGVVGRDNRING